MKRILTLVVVCAVSFAILVSCNKAVQPLSDAELL
jgi:hypothetical protein